MNRGTTLNDEESDGEDSEELLKDMLGGISFDAKWEEEEVTEKATPTTIPGTVSTFPVAKKSQVSTISRKVLPVSYQEADPSSAIFSYSYRCSGYCTIDGKVERPPLRVVLLGENRGHGLITTSPISRGSVIYTERASAATQVPPVTVQACQFCFRSLEYIDKLSIQLPCHDLWPVPRLEFPDDDSSQNLQSDKFGRVQCVSCKFLFCSKQHHDAFTMEYGSCCRMAAVQDSLTNLEQGAAVQAPVALAARLFVSCVQYYRRHGRQTLEGHFLQGFCGVARDLDALELGMKGRDGRYTLCTLYDNIVAILKITESEQTTLSLTYLHQVASHAARNGCGIHTQSPFKAYYAALLRKSMSRDSEEHESNMRQVAQALVGRDQLERGMDRDIDSKVAPEICAVFPLTARCNHSCEPNAQVRGQEFVDSHIDVVASSDLAVGEELLISYIPVGAGVKIRSATQRRRELRAKYLFHCDCARCSSGE